MQLNVRESRFGMNMPARGTTAWQKTGVKKRLRCVSRVSEDTGGPYPSKHIKTLKI